jgi:hypothetical protein
MNRPRGAEKEDCADAANSSKRSEVALSAVRSQDLLAYIAQMTRELQIMSLQANCEALARLLGRAHRQARRQICHGKGMGPRN